MYSFRLHIASFVSESDSTPAFCSSFLAHCPRELRVNVLESASFDLCLLPLLLVCCFSRSFRVFYKQKINTSITHPKPTDITMGEISDLRIQIRG
jgi:hypothetical protein